MKSLKKQLRQYLNSFTSLVLGRWYFFPKVPPDNKVLFFKRDRSDFGFLSNFQNCNLHIDGQTWPHVEAYYQSQKSSNPEYHKRILTKNYPSWSKYVGDSRIGNPKISKKSWFRKHPEDLKEDWDEIKLEVMEKALEAKFHQNANLKHALLATSPAKLIEDSENDYFWGCGKDQKGANHLGIILMKIREGL